MSSLSPNSVTPSMLFANPLIAAINTLSSSTPVLKSARVSVSSGTASAESPADAGTGCSLLDSGAGEAASSAAGLLSSSLGPVPGPGSGADPVACKSASKTVAAAPSSSFNESWASASCKSALDSAAGCVPLALASSAPASAAGACIASREPSGTVADAGAVALSSAAAASAAPADSAGHAACMGAGDFDFGVCIIAAWISGGSSSST
mmetsp:Transcript_13411/g.25389  ORF Transcript_13411/g.25389 Transcript_13411/m.25389 type:complete len:208 (-) Transcript_13411:404-1027(-)